MNLTDLEKELQETNEAISLIKKGGQEIQSKNGRVKMADLKLLLEEKARLESQIASLKRSTCNSGFNITPVTYYGRG